MANDRLADLDGASADWRHPSKRQCGAALKRRWTRIATTLGAPQYDAEGRICNAVLLLHSSTANRLHWLNGQLGSGLFGPGQPLDIERFFVVIPDLIGHGESSKPSDGLRTRFPAYRCQDMVNALHLLVTQGLKIPTLQLLMGTSLGAMLAWEWHATCMASEEVAPEKGIAF